MGEFGNKFRGAREKKNLTLDDVSNVTKISSRMLQAIEEERFDQLPGGVFNKGFIRAYAKHLGLNDEDAVSDYLACLRQAQIDAHEVWEPQAPVQSRAPESPRLVQPNLIQPNLIQPNLIQPNLVQRNLTQPNLTQPNLARPNLVQPNLTQRNSVQPSPVSARMTPQAEVEELPDLQLPRAEDIRPRRKEFSDAPDRAIPWRMLAAAALVMVLVVVLWTRRSHRTAAAAAVATPVQTEAAAPIASPAPAPVLNKTGSANPKTGGPAVAGRQSSPSQQPGNPQPALTSSPAATSRPTAGPVSSTAAAAQGNSGDVEPVVQKLPKSNRAASEKSAPPLTLVIRATETSWISVVADGQTVSQETLIAPANTSVRASHEIVAKVGNAAGVTFLFNGQEMPANGAEAEVKTFVFDANGMRVAPLSPAPAQ